MANFAQNIPFTVFSMKKRHILAAAAAVLAASVFAASDGNVIEEVAWMIGDQPIYKSEIEEAYQEMQSDRFGIPGDPYCFIPEQIAIERLFLHQADIDTVEVQESMVQMQVDQQMNYLIGNLGSREKVEQYFRNTRILCGKHAQPHPRAAGTPVAHKRHKGDSRRRAPLLLAASSRQYPLHTAAGRGSASDSEPRNSASGNRRRQGTSARLLRPHNPWRE